MLTWQCVLRHHHPTDQSYHRRSNRSNMGNRRPDDLDRLRSLQVHTPTSLNICVTKFGSAVICCCLPTMRPVIKFVWKRCGLKNLDSSGTADGSKPTSSTAGMWSSKSRQNSRHRQDTVLGNGNADEMELTKCAYYELHSDVPPHTSSQNSITEQVHQQV
jgi:hypothetical protein